MVEEIMSIAPRYQARLDEDYVVFDVVFIREGLKMYRQVWAKDELDVMHQMMTGVYAVMDRGERHD